MRYFAMLDTEDVVLIPGATTFEEAATYTDEEPGLCGVHWIFNEEGLREFVVNALAALSCLED